MSSACAQSKSDDEHKLAGVRQYAEDDEILRVPLAIAMVKLLQNLPRGTLRRNLPGYVTKRRPSPASVAELAPDATSCMQS